MERHAEPCGAYELVRLVAEGGTARVFEARRTDDGRRVAIKMFQAAPVSENRFRAYMLHEVYALNLGANPRLVKVHEFGETAIGSPYLVLEWLDGASLKELLPEVGVMPVRRALRLFEEVLDALEALHERGVVHADLAPDHVMVSPASDGDSTVRLIDLGAARAGGVQIGFPHERLDPHGYDAPEVVAGGLASRSSDIYSAGVMLLELLTGVSPCRGGFAGGLGEMDAVMTAVLNPDPAGRFADVASLRLAVRAGLPHDGLPDSSGPDPHGPQHPAARTVASTARRGRHLFSVP